MKTIESKVVLLGAQGVGKTSITVRYVDKQFSSRASPTIGASFFSCKMKFEDYKVKLQIWDTAGQERFKAMAPVFYRNANAAVLVFDLTNSYTFEDVRYWAQELHKNIEEAIVLFVIGNKNDLIGERQVKREEAQMYAESIGAEYLETSALNNDGIDDAFHMLALAVLERYKKMAERAKDIPEISASSATSDSGVVYLDDTITANGAKSWWCC